MCGATSKFCDAIVPFIGPIRFQKRKKKILWRQHWHHIHLYSRAERKTTALSTMPAIPRL